MSDLRDLYQELILDHSKRPRNFRRVAGANREAKGYNALCGDRIQVSLRVENDQLADLGFEGQGCAICTASASVMTETLKGKSAKEAEVAFEAFHELVTGASSDPDRDWGKLVVFAGVSEFPARVKCASLPWHTLRAALEARGDEPISTE